MAYTRGGGCVFLTRSGERAQLSTAGPRLVSCLVDNVLLQVRPCSRQASLQISDVPHGNAIDLDKLLHDAADFKVNWIQVWTILRPQLCGNTEAGIFDAVKSLLVFTRYSTTI